MPSAPSDISKGFWEQYPVATKLTWSFVLRQLNQDRIWLFNFARLMRSLIGHIMRVWRVVALPLGQGLRKDRFGPHMPQHSRTARLTYFAVFYPLGIIIGVLGFLGAAISTVGGVTVLLLLTVTVVTVGVFAISLIFIL
jgi:hypothetical protein